MSAVLAEPRRGRRWYRHPRQADAEQPPVAMPDVIFYGPYADRHDLWVGLYWVHQVQGWDGGWWESWRFYLVLLPTADWSTQNRNRRPWGSSAL